MTVHAYEIIMGISEGNIRKVFGTVSGMLVSGSPLS